MQLKPVDSVTYPLRITHKGHLAFRAKSSDSKGRDIIYPDGSHDEPQIYTYCGTCKAILTPLSMIAGDWKMDNRI